MGPAEPRGLVLFDGPCPLCQRTVRTLARLDRGGRLRFAPLAGETAARWRAAAGAAPPAAGAAPPSVLFLPWPPEAGHPALDRSAAVLAALVAIGGLAGFAAALARALPRPLRDLAYDAVARRRERWFGRAESCPAPPRRLAGRFLP